jgi:hypothetical protein
MEIEDFLEIDIIDVRAVDEEDEFFIGEFGEIEVSVNIFEVAFTSVIRRESGGEVSETVTPASEVPIFTGADMIEDGAGVVWEHEADGVNT